MTRGKGTWRPYRRRVDPDEDLTTHQPGQGLGTMAKWAQVTDPDEPPKPNSYAKGILGEQDVAARLDPLTRTGWRVLHSVMVNESGGDIDHVLIGPPGVFTINTKSHPGGRVDIKSDAIWVGRYRKDYAEHALAEAAQATNRLRFASGLNVTVIPTIIILTGPEGRLTIKSRPPGVMVIGGDEVPTAFEQMRPFYCAADVVRLHECLRYARSWFPKVQPVDLPAPRRPPDRHRELPHVP